MKTGKLRLSDRHPGAWPLPARLLLHLTIFLLAMLGGWRICLVADLAHLENLRQQESAQKISYIDKRAKLVNMPLLQRQLQQTTQEIHRIEQGFVSPDEIPDLLSHIATAAAACDLRIDFAEPRLPPQAKNTSAQVNQKIHEQAIEMRLRGNYHDLGRFAASLATLPKILVLNDLHLSDADNAESDANDDNKNNDLRMDVTVLTYDRHASEIRKENR